VDVEKNGINVEENIGKVLDAANQDHVLKKMIGILNVYKVLQNHQAHTNAVVTFTINVEAKNGKVLNVADKELVLNNLNGILNV